MQNAEKASASPRQRSHANHLRAEIPSVDQRRRIVGWTRTSPERDPASPFMIHEEAQRLVGGPLACAYVQIMDRAGAARAGAPSGWDRPWWCLALVAAGGTGGRRLDGSPVFNVTPERGGG